MFLKTILTTFGLVFLAELGDKTQLTTMFLVAENKSPWATFIGAALALVCSTIVGVLAGTVINQLIPAHYIHTAAGIAFLLIGVLLLWGKI